MGIRRDNELAGEHQVEADTPYYVATSAREQYLYERQRERMAESEA